MSSKDVKIKYWSLLLVLGIFSFAVFLSVSWEFTADDAFGIFRYSENIASGHGFVWNIGGEPVEGSSFLLYIILVGISYTGIGMVLASKVVGILSLIGVMVLFGAISKSIMKEFPKGLILLGFFISTTLLLTNPATAIHAVSGMDTMLLAFLLLGTVYAALITASNPTANSMALFSLSALALVLLRPEGLAVSILLLLFLFITKRNDGDFNKIKYIKIFSAFYILPIAIYTAWKTTYFGGFFNLAFLTKTLTHGGLFRGFPTFMRVMGYLSPYLLIILLASVLLLESGALGDKRRKMLVRNFTFLQASVLAAVSFIPVYMFSVMMMNFAQRYYYPIFVLVYIIAGTSIAILYNHLSDSESSLPRGQLMKSFGVAVSIILLIGANVYFISHLQETTQYAAGFSRGHVPLGKVMNKYKDSNLTMAAIDMGALSYYSGWRFIELGGLMDKYIAEHGAASYEYMETIDPDVIILISRSHDEYDENIIPLLSDMQEEVFEYAEKNGFVKAAGVRVWDGYYIIPFIKPDLEELPDMEKSIKTVAAKSLIS